MISTIFYLYLKFFVFLNKKIRRTHNIYKTVIRRSNFKMKKILSILAVIAVLVAIFSLAACSNEAENDIKNEMSTMKDDGMSMLDDLSSAASDIDEKLTEGGNVTDSGSSTGLFETMTTESTTVHSDAAE